VVNVLKPIPPKILRSTATVNVCNSIDSYQAPSYTEYTVRRVHLQPTNEIRKTQANTDCTLRAILFVDARISAPALDWCSLLQTAHTIGGDVKVSVRGVEYTVMGVDELRDDTDKLHHWEVSLV
jgi:hypothetical protein